MMTGVILAGGMNRRMGGKLKALLPIEGIPLIRLQLQEMSQLCRDILIVTQTPQLLKDAIDGFDSARVRYMADIWPGKGPLSGIHAACKALESANSLELVDAAAPADSLELVDSVAPADSLKLVDSEAPADSIELLDSVASTESAGYSDTANENLLWIVGCDMPYISAAAAEALGGLCLDGDADAAIPVIGGRIQPLHGVYHRRIAGIAEELLSKETYRLMGLMERIEWKKADDEFFLQRKIDLQFTMNLNTHEEYNEAVNKAVNKIVNKAAKADSDLL
ncbi:molybdenum cofactor guanylyltransferase [Paenibacillus eucommiae]|uniref:Molybdopterin-guanine dinucleotide biosynthesis protein A n=1 Tax=Paenibacillus eucommiae TaxID=1355755 RepID=A0ABS4J0U7_9BACL|nr:molybdenum cofactor guanylyltransferase [Paenibacillus eucommiae]MBP1992950.1 molybdopterin-guanine dinucleotide biosynthesis protein A [Paenibacillus eucommiae]